MTQPDVKTLITALGGREALQELLGVGPSAISNYLAKGALPHRARPLICEALRRRGYQVDPQGMEIIGLPPTGTLAPNTPVPNTAPPVPAPKDASHPAPQPHDKTVPMTKSILTTKSILMIVGGGIAAYKALEVSRRLQDHGVRVTGVMTKAAQQFITPLSLSALTGEKTYTDLFSLTDEAEMGHIRLARDADLVLVVPATANLMARAAQGLADDLATTLLLATTAPVIMVPTMNPAMWQHPATKSNLATLRHRTVQMVGPVAGDTACGEEGDGRMSDPADIVAATMARLMSATPPDLDTEPDTHLDTHLDREDTRGANTSGQSLRGQHAIVTSGPTCEPIDAVRYIANRSSGRQGHAIAAALAKAGAHVTLVSGPVTIADPPGVKVVHIETAAQMLAACEAALPADILVCAAAVADWRVESTVIGKLKKQAGHTAPPDLRLVENPDILATISAHQARPQLVIGFAAETDDLVRHATEKLHRKGCDWIVANHVDTDDAANNVFGSTVNKALFITQEGCEDWPVMAKTDLAEKLVTKIIKHSGASLVAV